ncbi:nucleotidyltransferase family protein (plasmid) [Skermanella rosea]|uniref:nucleotidyltransferase n=1 Tax=Skermanella rosea TaxID=1817965 RepID=UPI001933DE99|nr:nucleotidyltransferase [Skermanella rosea]UEM07958.1 nucleotidyltransferase family protein [Skermanella rosea]
MEQPLTQPQPLPPPDTAPAGRHHGGTSYAVLTGEALPPTGGVEQEEADRFYTDSLNILRDSGIPFLVAGTFAVNCYTGINRATKDLDIFCKPGDFPRILLHFKDHGFETEIHDERWLAKVKRGNCFFDVIFSSAVAVVTITDQWFNESHPAELYGVPVQLTPPTEMIWSKALLQNRNRYDGADIAHMILRQGDRIDWHRLLSHMEQYWEVLLIHVLNFRFIYPSERDRVPRWLMDELLQRARMHADLPVPLTRVCRGRLFSPEDYRVDVMEWGFADLVGAAIPAPDEGRTG